MVVRKRISGTKRHDSVRKLICNCLRRANRRAAGGLAGILLLTASFEAHAVELYSEDDLEVRWDNTLRYGAEVRLGPRSAALISDPNADDGDRNFLPGLVSNRVDLRSDFDLTEGRFGLHVSAAGWYDSVYHGRNDNDSPATFNPASVPHDEFTRAVRRLDGADAELLDAFANGSFDLGKQTLSFRIGRQTALWGESLFFAENGISAGQAPLDEIKELNSPIT